MRKKTILIILSFFSIYVFWGSTYMLNKMAVMQLSPFMLAGVRFSFAGILVLIIAKLLKKSLRVSKKQLINCTIAGFLFLAYGNGAIVWALKYVDSGFAALEASINPLLILILMRIYQKKAIKLKSIIGIALGIFGMYLLVSQKELTFQDGSTLAIIVIFTCVSCWAIGSLFIAQADLPKNFFIGTGYQMLTAGIILCIASGLFGESWIALTDWTLKTQLSMVGLVLFGSIAAFTSFNYLLKNVSPEKVATSAYVNPIIALLLGWKFLEEQITLQTISAAVLLLLGVYFINTKRDKISKSYNSPKR